MISGRNICQAERDCLVQELLKCLASYLNDLPCTNLKGKIASTINDCIPLLMQIMFRCEIYIYTAQQKFSTDFIIASRFECI